MQHSLEFDIRNHILAYLAGEISLRDFEDWFFPKTWEADESVDTTLLDLVYQIKLDWAEFTNGDWSENDLRSMLKSLTERITITSSTSRLIYGTSSKIIPYSSLSIRPDQFAGIKSVVVHG